jgi:hypothetical protein
MLLVNYDAESSTNYQVGIDDDHLYCSRLRTTRSLGDSSLKQCLYSTVARLLVSKKLLSFTL